MQLELQVVLLTSRPRAVLDSADCLRIFSIPVVSCLASREDVPSLMHHDMPRWLDILGRSHHFSGGIEQIWGKQRWGAASTMEKKYIK